MRPPLKKRTLTNLYNERPTWLDAFHRKLLAAYGFSPQKDLLQQLLDLNLEVAARIDRGESVTAPGIPPGFPDPQSLITDDCIRPPIDAVRK